MARFYPKLFKLLPDNELTADLGGPIIMAQVDNEYGLFGSDKAYLSFVRDTWRKGLGAGVVIHSTDPSSPAVLGGSRLDGVLQTLDGESGMAAAFANLRASQKLESNATMPLMNSEYYPGNLNYWGDATFPFVYPVANVVSGLDELLSTRLEGSSPPSFTLWLFNSQTDFGFMGSSLHFDSPGSTSGQFKWFVPSYDFGAPVDEAGLVRPLFYQLRAVLAKHGAKVPPPGTPLPPSPPVRDYGRVIMGESLSLFEALPLLAPHPVRSPTVLTMEETGQGYGYSLYSTTIPPWLRTTPVLLGGMRDFAGVFVARRLQQTCAHGAALDDVVCKPVSGQVQEDGRMQGDRDLQGAFRAKRRVLSLLE